MTSIQLEEITIQQVHDGFCGGLFTAQDLITVYLDRIQKIDRGEDGPKLNALLAINKDAVNQAKQLDALFEKDARFVGPLHGIPVVVKDHIKTEGITTTFGSIVTKNFVPEEDATVVTKLKEAGAIILAKGTLPDWGTDWFSTSSVSGHVRNPYDTERDTGGSSSGTAAAIAANLAVIGVGSDSGGSIRIPASFCNLVGFRPTVGLISSHGSSCGIHGQSTHGPMTRTVADAAIMMDVLAGYDEKEPLTSIHARRRLSGGESYTSQLGKQLNRSSIRIGIIRALFGDESFPEQAAVNAVIEDAMRKVREAGITLIEIEVPGLTNYLTTTNLFLARSRFDMEAFMKPNFGVDFPTLVSQKQFPPENVMIPWVAANGAASPYEVESYGKQVDLRDEFDRVVCGLMLKHDVSVLMFPTVKITAPRYSDIGPQRLRANLPANHGFASQLRWPAISIPAGFTSQGLPVGMEIVAPPLQDQTLLNVAYEVEQITKARRSPNLN